MDPSGPMNVYVYSLNVPQTEPPAVRVSLPFSRPALPGVMDLGLLKISFPVGTEGRSASFYPLVPCPTQPWAYMFHCVPFAAGWSVQTLLVTLCTPCQIQLWVCFCFSNPIPVHRASPVSSLRAAAVHGLHICPSLWDLSSLFKSGFLDTLTPWESHDMSLPIIEEEYHDFFSKDETVSLTYLRELATREVKTLCGAQCTFQ